MERKMEVQQPHVLFVQQENIQLEAKNARPVHPDLYPLSLEPASVSFVLLDLEPTQEAPHVLHVWLVNTQTAMEPV